MHTQTHTGYYGKLPMLGDFISRRLPRDFVTPWDGWLQSSITASREELAEHWLNSYLSSPIWRFALSAGVCGPSAWAGILMPSVDKVGRYFPLTMAANIGRGDCLPYLFCSSNTWFEQLEDAALSGLEGSLDPEAFDKLVQTIPCVAMDRPIQSSECQDAHQASGKNAFYLTMDHSNQMPDAFIGLSAALLDKFMRGYSLWATTGSDEQPSALLVCEGLLPIAAFSGLLNGRIGVRGWNLHKNGVPLNPDRFQKPLENEIIKVVSTANNTDREHNTVPRFLNNNGYPVNPAANWTSWSITDTGKRRKFNEDAILDRPEARLWAVADGMGGHTAGDVASQLIVDSLKHMPPEASLEAYADKVHHCLLRVNKELRELAEKSYHNRIVGSTVLVLIGDMDRCAYLWAGDSRLYRLRDNKLAQLTRDHCHSDDSSLQDSVALSGWGVKQSNIITRAVGADDELELDYEITDVKSGDVFLLSSDGLDKELSFHEIESILLTHENRDSVKTLVDLTLERGARDNVSVIVVKVDITRMNI